MIRNQILLLLLCGLFPCCTFAQFTDDFSDGNFTSNPTWSGDDALFVVVQEEGNFILRSSSPGQATYYLSTPSTQATNASWEFFVNLRFQVSGANYVDVYLASPQADLSTRPDGYFVRIGETPRRIALYRRQGSTNTLMVASPDQTVNSSSNNPFRIRVTRDPANNWTLSYQPGGQGTFTSAGTAVDATFNTSTHFGILITQSAAASPVNNHFFDDFIVGVLPADEEPPQLLNASVVDANTVDLLFDEPLAAATAQNTANYSVNNGLGQPATATLQGSSTVRLTFSAPFTSGTTYTVTVNGVQDLAGNAVSNATTTFLYFVPSDPEYRDVVFNEFMADPTPSQGLPESEYIELFNTTQDKFFQLQGWKITTNTSQVTLPAYALAPGEFVVFANTGHIEGFADLPNAVAYTLSNTALVNAGTTLTLLDPDENVIDQLAYNIDWYGDAAFSGGGWSLEQINPFHPCSTANNWTASTSPTGGTPGAQNAAFSPDPDTTPPQLLSANLTSTDQVELLFSEPMDVNSLTTGTYSIDPALAIASVQLVSADPSRVLLMLAATPPLHIVHTVTVTGVLDCIGNPIGEDNTATFFYFIPAAPEYRDVVINELMAAPSPPLGLPDSEYIELFNATTDKYFQLSGWQITTNTAQSTLPAFALPPGGYALLVNNNNLPLFDQVENRLGISLSGTALVNSGTTVSLVDPDGEIVDRVPYTTAWYGDPDRSGGGWSIEQIDPFHPCSTRDNWRASDHPDGGTPGTQNSIYDPTPDTTPPALVSAFMVAPDLLQLDFSEAMDAASIQAGTYVIDPAIGISQVTVNSDRRIYLALVDEPQVGTVYTVTVTGVTDCVGNPIGANNSATIAIPEPAAPGDVVINEVMYDPATGSSEFVELYNRSAKVIDLSGMQIGRALTDLSNRRVIIDEPWILMPDAYVVITSSISNVAAHYPQSRTDRFIQMNLPSLPNSGGTVSFLDGQDVVIDIFDYHPNMHFGLLSNAKGFSLERIDPWRDTNEFTNWQSASENIGRATPGFVNSQYSEAPQPTGTMTIDPAIFSPDNDGHQDVLTITYQFEQHGFAGTILIFDVAGREVRRLMDSQLLGTSGSISWDGILDNGSKGRMGPYIVMMEAFDIEGNVERFKQTVTLAHYLD